MEHATRAMLDRMKLWLPSLRNASSRLSGGQRQAVAIAPSRLFRCASPDHGRADRGARAGGDREGRRADPRIASQGIGIILISHDIHDVFDLADRLAVMKNGRLVGTVVPDGGRVDEDQVLAMIIPPGRRLTGSGHEPPDEGVDATCPSLAAGARRQSRAHRQQ